MAEWNGLHGALKNLWHKRLGVGDGVVPALDSGVVLSVRNNAGTSTLDLIRTGADDNIHIAGSVALRPVYRPCICRIGPNGEAVDHVFHNFNQPSTIASGKPIGRVVAVEGWFKTQASVGTVTAQIKKLARRQTIVAGTSLTTDSFNLRGTNATRQQLTLVSTQSTLEFTGGDRLAIDITGTPTSFAGGLFIVWVQYYVNMAETSFRRIGTDTAGTDEQFFVANRPYTVWGINASWTTAEATATRKLQVTNDTSTNAAGAGTNLLTDNSDAGFDLKAVPNIVYAGTLTATAADKVLATGNRLAVDYTGAPTELANLCVTVAYTPQAERLEVSYYRHDTDVLDEAFFLSNRDLEVWDGRQIHGVAAGGASVAQLVKDSGTDAPGGGVDLLGTTWDLNATAQTVQAAAFITTAARVALLMTDGDRLAIDYANTEQSLLGVAQTVSLMAR